VTAAEAQRLFDRYDVRWPWALHRRHDWPTIILWQKSGQSPVWLPSTMSPASPPSLYARSSQTTAFRHPDTMRRPNHRRCQQFRHWKKRFLMQDGAAARAGLTLPDAMIIEVSAAAPLAL